MFQQLIPHERGLGKAVQEHQHRAPTLAGGAATQGDAVGQRLLEGLDGHGFSAWVQSQSSSAVSSTPCFLSAENSFASPPPACSRAIDSARVASLRDSLSALVSSTRNFRP